MPASLLSILVPLFNEEEYIAPLLSRALAAPLPDGLEREIIVVDDGSTDGSDRIVEEFAARHPSRCVWSVTTGIAARVRRSEPQSPKRAANTA